MKKIGLLICLLLFIISQNAYASLGDNGYEGGISSGYLAMHRVEYDYKEVVFITGEPIIFEGKLEISKKIKEDSETYSYDYTLTHGEKDTLKRKFDIETKIEEKNGQKTKSSSLKSRPKETIKIGDETYTLDANYNVDFSLGVIIDDKAFSDYFAGNFDSKKTFEDSTGTKKITVSTNGQIYGYQQKWSSTETQELKITIKSEGISEDGVDDSWSGVVDMKIASTMVKRLLYIDNKPNEISFAGGYLERQENSSVLSYSGKFPRFDSDGMATDNIKTYKDDISIESFPEQRRLIVPELKKIEGHWYEKDVSQLYSLEIYNIEEEPASEFEPNMYMTRAEFAKALALLGELMPDEKTSTAKINPRLLIGGKSNSNSGDDINGSFEDVPENHPYYNYIKAVSDNDVMLGTIPKRFEPDRIITRSQAVTTFIRALGLESIAPNPIAVTYFRDNDDIPYWARNSVKVASYIGIINGDDYGYFNPNEPMTKAQASAMLNRLINYMRYNIIKDYMNRIMTY